MLVQIATYCEYLLSASVCSSFQFYLCEAAFCVCSQLSKASKKAKKMVCECVYDPGNACTFTIT